MASSAPAHLRPRKKPLQARATVTLDAIFEATTQVLLTDGPNRLTTSRVASRAGVSVGTMYQYFPHKQALFYGLNERYMDALAVKVETACLRQHGAPIDQMAEALVTAYWNAKWERPEVTRAIYRSVVEFDNEALIETFVRRADSAANAMFGSACDATFIDLSIVILTLLTAIFGAVRSVFDRNLPDSQRDIMHHQIILMCIAYLKAARIDQSSRIREAEL